MWYFCGVILSSVNLQTNDYGCGLFICQYAYAMYALKHMNFKYHVRFREKEPMSSIMDANDLFKCTQSTVTQFRSELKILIEHFSTVFKTEDPLIQSLAIQYSLPCKSTNQEMEKSVSVQGSTDAVVLYMKEKFYKVYGEYYEKAIPAGTSLIT